MENKNLLFRQLFEKESSTYTYLLADKGTKEAIIIDPVKETVERDHKLIEELGLSLKYILDTHVHADHVTASNDLRKLTKAQVIQGINTKVTCADKLVGEGEVIEFGQFSLKAIETPGHTNGCTSYYLEQEEMVFTGDTLLIRSCGRTDFQQGSSERLYESIQKLFSLPDTTLVMPAHNYIGLTISSIKEEMQFNEFANTSTPKEKFVEKLDNLQLSLPKKIHIAVPSNMVCGSEIIEGKAQDFVKKK